MAPGELGAELCDDSRGDGGDGAGGGPATTDAREFERGVTVRAHLPADRLAHNGQRVRETGRRMFIRDHRGKETGAGSASNCGGSSCTTGGEPAAGTGLTVTGCQLFAGWPAAHGRGGGGGIAPDPKRWPTWSGDGAAPRTTGDGIERLHRRCRQAHDRSRGRLDGRPGAVLGHLHVLTRLLPGVLAGAAATPLPALPRCDGRRSSARRCPSRGACRGRRSRGTSGGRCA